MRFHQKLYIAGIWIINLNTLWFVRPLSENLFPSGKCSAYALVSAFMGSECCFVFLCLYEKMDDFNRILQPAGTACVTAQLSGDGRFRTLEIGRAHV